MRKETIKANQPTSFIYFFAKSSMIPAMRYENQTRILASQNRTVLLRMRTIANFYRTKRSQDAEPSRFHSDSLAFAKWNACRGGNSLHFSTSLASLWRLIRTILCSSSWSSFITVNEQRCEVRCELQSRLYTITAGLEVSISPTQSRVMSLTPA